MSEQEIQSTDWNVDDYRNPWESVEEWEFRKHFMEAFKTSIPEDELVCLAQVFTNMEFLGCSYPDEVVTRVNDLAKNIMDELPDRRRKRKDVAFVKANEDDNGSAKGNKRKDSKLDLPPPKHRPSEFIKPGNRLNAASYFGPTTGETSSTNYNTQPKVSGNKYQMQNYYTSSYKQSQEKLTQGTGAPPRHAPEVIDLDSDHAPVTNRNSVSAADISGKKDVEESKFRKLANVLNKEISASREYNVLEVMNRGITKQQMTIECLVNDINHDSKSNRTFKCDVVIDEIFVASGEGLSKKSARKQAYENVIANLSDPKLCFLNTRLEVLPTRETTPSNIESSDRLEKTVSKIDYPQLNLSKHSNSYNVNEQPAGPSAMKLKVKKLTERPNYPSSGSINFEEGKYVFQNFVIRHLDKALNALTILRTSAEYNAKKLEFTQKCEAGNSENMHRCEIQIQSVILGGGSGSTKPEAMAAAAEEALAKLRTVSYTIVVKRAVLAGEVVSKKALNLLENEAFINSCNAIPESNMGNKLLRLMGWTGGGLGKEGNTGIVEPITAELRQGRSGIGHEATSSNITRTFEVRVRKVIAAYANEDTEFDLVFTSEFTKEERAFMHRLASKFHLKSASRDNSDERYLIISKRYTPMELVKRLFFVGGTNEKYELIPPTG